MTAENTLYIRGGDMASVAREHVWRDVTGFLAYHLFMALPLRAVPWKFVLWLAPSIGDWSERDARWTFALEEALQPKPDGE